MRASIQTNSLEFGRKKEKQFVENIYARIEISSGIVHARWKSDNVDLSIAKAAVAARLTVTGNRSYQMIADTRQVKSISKEAREYLSSRDGCAGVTRAAILINSSLGSTVVNFFLKINRPLVPTKIFTSEAAAVKWLSAEKLTSRIPQEV